MKKIVLSILSILCTIRASATQPSYNDSPKLQELTFTHEQTSDQEETIRSSICKRLCGLQAKTIDTCDLTVRNNLTNCGRLILKGLNGALMANNGVVMTALITNDKLAPNAVENINIADNAVSGNKIADNTITPSKLNFNIIQVFESALQGYRGSVNGADGAIISGQNFTATRTGAGTYQIQTNIGSPPFESTENYQVFITPHEANRIPFISKLDARTFIITITDGISPQDTTFDFFAIGESAAPALKKF